MINLHQIKEAAINQNWVRQIEDLSFFLLFFTQKWWTYLVKYEPLGTENSDIDLFNLQNNTSKDLLTNNHLWVIIVYTIVLFSVHHHL